MSYSYDAVRVPVRLAGSCDRADVALAARLWPILRRPLDAGQPLVGLDQGGSPQAGASDAPVGLIGAAAATAAAGDASEARHLLDRAGAANDSDPTYYGSAWVALGRLLLQTRDLGGCPPLAR